MKKYIITEAMLNTIQSLAMPRNLAEELDELKPIEPMSDEDMAHIIEHTNNIEGQYFLPFSFAREIERHIIGSETP